MFCVKFIVFGISIYSLVYRIIRSTLSWWNLLANCVLPSEFVWLARLAALRRNVQSLLGFADSSAFLKIIGALLLHMALELFPEDLRWWLGFLGVHVAHCLWLEHCILRSVITLNLVTGRQRVIHAMSHVLVSLLGLLVISHKYWILGIQWLAA